MWKRIQKKIRQKKVNDFESALAYACYKLTGKEKSNTYLILRAQAKHETGNYTSELFTKANNAFGMKYYTGSIYQAGNYNGYGYARYNDYEACISDLIAWLTAKGIYPEGLNLYIYVTALKAGRYFQDSILNYYIGCKRYYL